MRAACAKRARRRPREWGEPIGSVGLVSAGDICQICRQRPADTVEHFPPNWLVPLVSDRRESPSPDVRMQIMEGPWSALERRYSLTVPCCDQCNQWMNTTLEQPIKRDGILEELIFASRTLTSIAAEDQALLAAWLYKGAIVSDAIGRQAEPRLLDLIPLDERRSFLAHGQPPPFVNVWMGRLVDPRRWTVSTTDPLPERLSLPVGHTCWGAPLLIKRLFWMVISQPGPVRMPLPLPPSFCPYLRQIWPVLGPVDWPPAREINLQVRDALLPTVRLA